MNRIVAGMVMGLALGAVSAVSAQSLSVGGGGFFASDFGGGFTSIKLKYAPEGIDRSSSVPWVGGGFNVFFDASYVELGLGLTFAGGTPQVTNKGETEKVNEVSISGTGLGLSVLGKYPVPLGETMTFFPMVGIDYLICLSAEQKAYGETYKLDGKDGRPKAGDASALWFKLGVGFDYNLTEQLYLRPAILYGIRLKNKLESDAIDGYSEGAPSDAEIGSVLGHGLTIRVGVGFKL